MTRKRIKPRRGRVFMTKAELSHLNMLAIQLHRRFPDSDDRHKYIQGLIRALDTEPYYDVQSPQAEETTQCIDISESEEGD